jgi:hypothetical protein
VREITDSLADRVVLGHKSFRSVFCADSWSSASHRWDSSGKGQLQGPPCVKHSGGRDQTGTTFVAGVEHKIPLWWNLSEIFSESS